VTVTVANIAVGSVATTAPRNDPIEPEAAVVTFQVPVAKIIPIDGTAPLEVAIITM
jgi:hypothetical protein